MSLDRCVKILPNLIFINRIYAYTAVAATLIPMMPSMPCGSFIMKAFKNCGRGGLIFPLCSETLVRAVVIGFIQIGYGTRLQSKIYSRALPSDIRPNRCTHCQVQIVPRFSTKKMFKVYSISLPRNCRVGQCQHDNPGGQRATLTSCYSGVLSN